MSIAQKLLTIANNTRPVADAVNSAMTHANGKSVVLKNTIVGEPAEIKLSSKNLLTTSNRVVRNFGALANTTQRSFTENSVYLNVSANNYCNISHEMSFEAISSNSFTLLTPTTGNGGWEAYGAAFNFKVKPNTDYVVSAGFDTTKGKIIGFGFYDESGNYIRAITTTNNITTPDNCVWMNVIFGVLVQNEAVLFENIQLEESTTATAYAPYTTDFSNSEVVATGKNLFNIAEPKLSGVANISIKSDGVVEVSQYNKNSYCSANIPIPLCENLVGKTITISCYVRSLGANKAAIRVLWGTGTGLAAGSHIMTSGVTSDEFTFVSKTGVVPAQPGAEYDTLCLYIYSNTDATLTDSISYAEYKDIQIEIGDSVTDYEPYKEPQTATADANDKVSGITPYSPNTTLFSVNEAATLNVKYFAETERNICERYRALQQEQSALQAYLCDKL